MKQFETPSDTIGSIDAKAAGRLIATASDIALVVDPDGVVRDLAIGGAELSEQDCSAWLGQAWSDTVTLESREKVEDLLNEASGPGAKAWRQVNHPSSRGPDLPVEYSAVKVGSKGNVVVVGRDLSAVASLQQRQIEAQQSTEREYAKLRHAETRYRLLFQIASEAVLIVNSANRKVVEANPAAAGLLGKPVSKIVGSAFPSGFDHQSTKALQGMLSASELAGRADEIEVRLTAADKPLLALATLFRHQRSAYFLVRLSSMDEPRRDARVPRRKSKLLEVVDACPDGFVVTDLDGRVLTANRAFLDMAQLATEEQARDLPLDRWLGRPGVDFNVLRNNLRQHGSVRLFATTLQGDLGTPVDIEISAVSAEDGEEPCLGFAIRNVGHRLTAAPVNDRQLPRSVDQLTDLVGRVSLKDIVRETTDVIERLCIEAALEITSDNRASAAEMLGLSRQSLYVKLRRHGLADAGTDTEH